MVASMMACGGMVKDQVLVHSATVMGMCFKVHGEMISFMERYVDFFFG